MTEGVTWKEKAHGRTQPLQVASIVAAPAAAASARKTAFNGTHRLIQEENIDEVKTLLALIKHTDGTMVRRLLLLCDDVLKK